jgi:hypothetical protein
MIIKAYLYSNRTRQLNHKYYSLSTDRDIRLFLDLNQDTAYFSKLENKAFVYEVEVETKDVIECAYSYLKATAFRIKNRVDFRTVANEMSIVTQTINKINSILDGNIEEEELFALYKKYMSKRPISLSSAEQMKFLAILNQTKYELPYLDPIYFVHIRLFEDCKIPYSLPESYTDSLNIKREFLFGSNIFESHKSISNEKFKNYGEIATLIQTRKLSQIQFEEAIQNMQEIIKNTDFKEVAVAAGYKIPYKYRELFYPYVIYQNPELVLDLVEKYGEVRTCKELLFDKGYKFKGWKYTEQRHTLAEQARKIFSKDSNYKIIEI